MQLLSALKKLGRAIAKQDTKAIRSTLKKLDELWSPYRKAG